MDIEQSPNWLRRVVKSGNNPGIEVLADEPLWHCLTCGAKISDFDFGTNNGTCQACPRLTEISAAFWKVISRRAAMGDLEAQRTMTVYG